MTMTAIASAYRRNPYSLACVTEPLSPDSYSYNVMMRAVAENHLGDVPPQQAFATAEEVHRMMPRQHTSLFGIVPYVAFPVALVAQPHVALDGLERLFFGQLPYYISPEELNYAIQTICGCSVLYSERIMKRGRPTGCVHGYVLSGEKDAVLAASKLVLFDDAGFHLASNAEQRQSIERYCEALKLDQSLRVPAIPYQRMTVEEPQSKFVPRS